MSRAGIVVSVDAVTVACLSDAETPWVRVVPRSTDLVADIVSALMAMPRGSLLRPRVTAVVDGIAVSKTVRGLPTTRRPRTLHRVLMDAPERFFLGERGSIVPTNVVVESPGVVSAAAIPIAIIDGIVGACVEANCTLTRITVSDFLIRLVGGEAMSAVNLALRAATIGRRARIAIVPHANKRHFSARTTTIGATLLIVGFLSLTGIRPFVQSRAIERGKKEIARLAADRSVALRTKAALDSTAATISAVADFAERRASVTLLLNAINDALPNGAALMSLQCDSSGVLLVVVAPNVTDVVRDIAETPGVLDVQINGSVSHDATIHQTAPVTTIGAPGFTAAPLERVMLKFRVDPGVLARGTHVDLRQVPVHA